ncbi:hypothetical protein ACS8MQ_01430 [Pseudomonas sp. MAHUQ-62]|uniref:hypothetical protein n=1 Tax=Pseudomonas sp. GCM10023245 TaxID=3252652 RepID=UPI003610441F
MFEQTPRSAVQGYDRQRRVIHWNRASELPLQRSDGNPVTVFSSHLVLRNLHNQLELYCVDIDFSAPKSARDALRQSENRYQELLQSLGQLAPERQSSSGEQGQDERYRPPVGCLMLVIFCHLGGSTLSFPAT